MNNFYKLINSDLKKYSQNNQDILALWVNKNRPGYFVEFGATDGVSSSNTLLLEEKGWDGIVAEPSDVFHESIFKNRKCHIDTSCVSNTTGDTVVFYEVGNSGLSSMAKYANNDHWAGARAEHVEKEVTTITLKDLLDKYDAPKNIDYLSIDTEGAEFDILSAYDFSRNFKLITVEHNHTPMKDQINELLNDKGYVQIFSDLSDWDNWYIYPALLGQDLK
jgi:FkbM family methyltransferase